MKKILILALFGAVVFITSNVQALEGPADVVGEIANTPSTDPTSTSSMIVNLPGGGTSISLTQTWVTATQIVTITTTWTFDADGNLTDLQSNTTRAPNPLGLKK